MLLSVRFGTNFAMTPFSQKHRMRVYRTFSPVAQLLLNAGVKPETVEQD
jgi:hypothetical protein